MWNLYAILGQSIAFTGIHPSRHLDSIHSCSIQADSQHHLEIPVDGSSAFWLDCLCSAGKHSTKIIALTWKLEGGSLHQCSVVPEPTGPAQSRLLIGSQFLAIAALLLWSLTPLFPHHGDWGRAVCPVVPCLLVLISSVHIECAYWKSMCWAVEVTRGFFASDQKADRNKIFGIRYVI